MVPFEFRVLSALEGMDARSYTVSTRQVNQQQRGGVIFISQPKIRIVVSDADGIRNFTVNFKTFLRPLGAVQLFFECNPHTRNSNFGQRLHISVQRIF